MEGIRASGNQQSEKANASNPQDAGSAKPAQPQILSPKQAAEAMVESGVNRHAQRIDVLFLKAVWGGIFLSYGGMYEAVVGGVSSTINSEWAGVIRLLEGLVFPVGLAMIVLAGMELLTSDMMFFFIAALKGRIPWWSVPFALTVIFFGNLCGSLFFAGILVKYPAIINSQAIHNFVTTATHTRVVLTHWHELFLRGIGCNIMVCMAVYLAAMSSDLLGKVVGIWIALSTFVVIQYEHVVADMFTIPMGLILGTEGATVGRYIGTTMMSALIGNFIGALLLSLTLYWCYLHDTTSPIVPVHRSRDSDEERTVNGESVPAGPGGKGTFGHPTKIQHMFRPQKHEMHNDFKHSNYERSHF